MKIIMEFKLPKDVDDFTAAHKGKDYFFVLWKLYDYFRSILKYEADKSLDFKTVEKIESKFYEFMDATNVSLDDIR